jgi:hypothetical protein
MGIVLSPQKEDIESLYGSFWVWRPAVALLQDAGVIDLEGIGPIPESFLYAEVDAEQAERIADYLDTFIQKLDDDERLLLDGSITDVPDTGEFYRDPAEQHKNYSAPKQWLVKFRDFCRSSGGFKIN